METVSAQLLKPGPVRGDWRSGGVDIYALLETAPGGTAKNYLLSIDKDGERSIEAVSVAKSAMPAPARWRPVIQSGAAQPAVATLTILHLSGPYFMIGWDGERQRVGDAFCNGGISGAQLYSDPDITADAELPAHLVPTVFNSMVRRFKDVKLCWRYDRQGDGYAVFYFLEDGRTLPGMDQAAERVTIVPAAPLQDLLLPDAGQD